MNGTLTLKNPVMINGDKITEMKYDTNEIDGVLFATAEAKRKAAAGMKNLSVSAAAEFDFGLQQCSRGPQIHEPRRVGR